MPGKIGLRRIFRRNKKAKNGKDYDVMNPEAENPSVSAAKKQGWKALRKVRKTYCQNSFKSRKVIYRIRSNRNLYSYCNSCIY